MSHWKQYSYDAISAVFLVLALDLIIANHAATLEPIYGSAPTWLHFWNIFRVAALAAMSTPSTVALKIAEYFHIVGSVLFAMPLLSHLLAVHTSRFGNPLWGPVVVHAAILLPISYAFIVTATIHAWNSLASMTRMHRLQSPLSPTMRSLSCLYWMILFQMTPKLFFVSPGYLKCIRIAAIIFAMEAMRISFQTGSRVRPRKNFAYGMSKVLTLMMLISQLRFSALRPQLLPHPFVGAYLHPTYPLRILFSVDSVTGVIVVGEVLPRGPNIAGINSMRYLRAGHSLIGGAWTGDNVDAIDGKPLAIDKQGNALGDSIYSAFVLQEAVRLFRRPEKQMSRQDKALIIGLGAGNAATALKQHSASVTVVEIDPAVYDAATQYFGLPVLEPEYIFLEDARTWVRRQRSTVEALNGRQRDEALFDIVVHDCFSGGGVPRHVFTVEFWQDLKTIVQPDGVIAVNFAGKLGTKESRAVLVTLQTVFPRCRAFHDSTEAVTREQLFSGFHNIVLFCTASKQDALRLRRATEADYLNSHLRRLVLSTLAEREIDLGSIIGNASSAPHEHGPSRWVLTDERNPLGEWQELGALEHWKVMRQVLPDVVWETY